MVISRVPPPQDGSKPKTSSAVAIILVLAVVLGIWLINGRDPGTGTGVGTDGFSESAPSVPPAEPAVDDSGSPTSDPTSGVPTQEPSQEPSQQPSREPVEVAVDPDSGLRYVDLGDLPPEAADTVDLIDAGGPFPYDKDGSTFGNFEGILPDRERGYYQEFTVETPGSDDRGARRIVEGADGELYWTEDHYDSFERIRP